MIFTELHKNPFIRAYASNEWVNLMFYILFNSCHLRIMMSSILFYYSQTSGVPSTLAVLKDVPQPQDAMAFGLSMVKPPPIKDCL